MIVLAWLAFGIPIALVIILLIASFMEEFSNWKEFVAFLIACMIIILMVWGFVWGGKTLFHYYTPNTPDTTTNSVPAVQVEKPL